MHRRSLLLVAASLVGLSACVSDLAVVGSYTSLEHGTITLGDDGNGSWDRPDGQVHIERWRSKDSADVTFTTEDGVVHEGAVTDGVLVLDPGPGTGGLPVTFELTVQTRHP